MKQRIISIVRRIGKLKLIFNIYEALKTVDLRNLLRNAQYRWAKAPDGIPIPPAKLIVSVAGTSDIRSFLAGGKAAKDSIISTLDSNGIEIEHLQTILDFGCGCGRVIRHWNSLKNPLIFGSDYNSRLIEWCKNNLTFAKFDTNQLSPPLRYEDDTFDFIYALSVFTHLPEALQQQWIDELSRILKPEGHLLITTHGEHYLKILTPTEKANFKAGQLVVRYQEVAGTNMCSVFHPEKYVRDKLTKDFVVVDFVPEGARGNPCQDIYLLKRPTI
jgi:SAM-dependent methyltransferase